MCRKGVYAPLAELHYRDGDGGENLTRLLREHIA